jgi:hypothetical protein
LTFNVFGVKLFLKLSNGHGSCLPRKIANSIKVRPLPWPHFMMLSKH